MVFNHGLQVGNEIDNSQLASVFKCAPQGGMRRSHETNTLVLILNPFRSTYVDRWHDDIFYYTGLGQTGNQELNYSQNKTLTESNGNGVGLHLFEVFEEKIYTYIGPVWLCESPFTEKQLDIEGN